MQALPAPPPPPARRQVLVGTSLASVIVAMLTGGMLAVWALQRTRALDAGTSWLPEGVHIPEVPSNVMLIAFVPLCICAQWIHWSATRGDRGHATLALGLTILLALMVINAQFFVYVEMGLGISEGAYGSMFYAITGVFVALMAIGIIFSTVVGFRIMGGRAEGELLAAHALYWYVIAAIYAAIWFVVYVVK